MATFLTPLELQASGIVASVIVAILATIRRLRKQPDLTHAVDDYLLAQLKLMSLRVTALENEGRRKDERIAELEDEIGELRKQLNER